MARFELAGSLMQVGVTLEVGEHADVSLIDGTGLYVSMEDASAASTLEVPTGQVRVIRVTGTLAFRQTKLLAMDAKGSVLAEMSVSVGPFHAGFRGAPNIAFRDKAIVTLDRGTSLTVAAADPGLLSVTEDVAAATSTHRRFRVGRTIGPGETKLLASGPDGVAYASVRVSIVDVVLGPSPITPNGNSTIVQPPGDVPDDLMDAVDEGRLPCENSRAQWLPVQAKFAIQYFLHAYHHCWKRGLDPRSALILLAQAGIETSMGKPGFSPNTPENNFLSLQPLPELQAILKDAPYHVPIALEPRSSGKGAPPSPCPIFRDIDQSIEVMFEVALAWSHYHGMRDALRGSPPSPVAYAQMADAAKWGEKYSKGPNDPPGQTNLPDEYDTCRAFIKRTLAKLPSSFMEETVLWGARVALQL